MIVFTSKLDHKFYTSDMHIIDSIIDFDKFMCMYVFIYDHNHNKMMRY